MKLAEVQVRYQSKTIGKEKIVSADKAHTLLLEHWNMNTFDLQEEFKVLLLNRSNFPLGIYTLSKGGNHGTIVDLKVLMAVLIKSIASGIILCHNHPSGSIKPSKEDERITNQIHSACKMFNIVLLDHIIITRNSYYSFADEGLLY